MKTSDLTAFGALLADVMAYYRQDVSDFTRRLFWDALQPFEFEQVRRTFETHAKDPEHGRFAPKVADMVRILQGTHTDRAQLAWGNCLEAMRWPGAYTDVIFSDAATHAVVEDLGGWPKLCRTPTEELGYVQAAFCKSHKAYIGRGTFNYPKLVSGERDPDDIYIKHGVPIPKPVLVGDPKLCALVYEGGQAGGKTTMTFASLGALAALALPRRVAANDEVIDVRQKLSERDA